MDADLRPGDEVAGHRLGRVIGRGGMSVVYLAEHLRLGRKVAFKVLAPGLAEDPGFRERFVRESRTAAGLDHPNIVTVYDAGEIDGLLYISMRFVEGSDLGRVLQDDGALEPWRTLTIASQVGSALDAAHAEGLVHRDVKPGNILLSHPGTTLERAFLSDFGVTKRMTTSAALTRTGGFVGTVDYVAPEQILDEPVDGRADVYSLGCVMYQCLSGRIPFPRPTEIATVYAQLHDEVPVLPEGAYPGMDPVIARALSKDKDDRYPTCTALVEAARSNVHGNASTEIRVTPEAVVADTTEMPVPREPRNWRPAWIGVAAFVAIAAITTAAIALAGRDRGAVGATSTTTSTSPPPTSSPPSRPTRSFDPAHLHWDEEDRSVFAQASGEVTFTDAIGIPEHQVIAIGHADELDEDAVVWTKVGARWQPDFVDRRGAPGDQKLEGLAWVNDRRLVAVGYDSGSPVSWYSDDEGHRWVKGTGLTSGTDAKAVVQAKDGTIWALGPAGAWTSSDGAVWTSADGSAFANAYAWSAVAYGNTVVAVGAAGPEGSRDVAVWVLQDGTWTRVELPDSATSGDQYLKDVTYNPDTRRLVAVGADMTSTTALIWTSADGTTWQRSTLLPDGGAQLLSSVLYVPGSPGAFIAAGWNDRSGGDMDAAIWYSRDGTRWILQRGADTYHLHGPGLGQIRALAPYGRQGIEIYAFGMRGIDKAGKPRLWRGNS